MTEPAGAAVTIAEEAAKLAQLSRRLQELKQDPGSLLESLYAAQELFGHVTPASIELIAQELGYPEAHVFGVVTFYTMFYTEPQPKYILRVCRDLSCHLAGARNIARRISSELGIHPGEATEDGLFKLELVSCLGQCEKQPAMLVNLEPQGQLTEDGVAGLIKRLREAE